MHAACRETRPRRQTAGALSFLEIEVKVRVLSRFTSRLLGVQMSHKHILALLAGCKPELARRFGVTRLSLFGSMARGTARSDSDVDILVAFDGPATSARYFGAQFYLEDLLGRRVDLVTEKALRPELRPYIEREAVRV